ncbi:MAG: hypothetical protein FJ265_14145, partial [Planctomycetes bacterium]|nr:hypothetical protein [Planctomycetota bacterium]
MTQTDPTPEILTAELLASGPFARANAPFRLLWVRGPDAAGFLHRLCSQDVLGLGIGEAKPAAFLDSKGKLLVTCLVGRLPDGFVLEVATAQAERLAALLERYHFTEKLTIAPAAAGCGERIAAAAVDGASIASDVVGGVVLRWARRGIGHERRHGGAAAEVGGEGAPLAEP